MVEDQKPPALVVPADLRAGVVDGAAGAFSPGPVPEERAGMGQPGKDAPVVKEGTVVLCHLNRALFTGIMVADLEAVLPQFFRDEMDIPEPAAAFPAPETFKSQGVFPRSYQFLPEHQHDLERDQDDDDPFEEVGVLDAHFVREHRVVLLDQFDLPAHALAPLAAS
jgi:hypothetical protein